MATLPQYPLSREELRNQPEGDAQEAGELQIPSQLSFAQEVRTERLSILWKLTLFGAFMVWWGLFVISGGRDIPLAKFFMPTVILTVGCVLTGQLLNREHFHQAAWAYALGAIGTVGLAMYHRTTFGTEFAPYLFPLLLFVVGLLLPVRDTLTIMLIVFGVALGSPFLSTGDFEVPEAVSFALILTAVATGLSAQVSGELYAIAEWALENYRKERQTTFALFESRQALEKSLLRQQALTMQVQETNRELEISRHAEEEAKNFRGQFLANMSHELRTPLNAIIGFSQTMLDFPAMYDNVNLAPQYRQDMNQILSSGKVLLAIINDILDLSKVDAGKLELEIQPVDLGPIIKGVMATAVGLVGDKKTQVELQKDIPKDLPMVMGDPLRVRQVLLNLYSNAAKFTDVGHIRLVVTEEGDEVVFILEDTGIGISDAERTTIFEEFRQGTAGRKKGRQGAGLGLAISQQLLRLMNGRLWFDSTVGKGSSFYFALPRYVPEEGAEVQEAVTAEEGQPTTAADKAAPGTPADSLVPEAKTTTTTADVSSG